MIRRRVAQPPDRKETSTSVSEVLIGVLLTAGPVVEFSYVDERLTVTVTAEDGARHSESMTLIQWCDGVSRHPTDEALRFLLRELYGAEVSG